MIDQTLLIHSVSVEMRPPGASTWTRLANSTDDNKRAWPIDELEISWSRPTPLDHPDPGEYRLCLLMDPQSADAKLLAYDTQIQVNAVCTLAGSDSPERIRLMHGWLSAWNRHLPRPDGRCIFELSIIDILGRAASTTLADSPWPEELLATRVNRINKISPSGQFMRPERSDIQVGARDVDNSNALDTLRRLAAPGEIITIDWRAPELLKIEEISRPQATAPNAIRIPASLIEDTGRRLDRTATITEIGITAWWDRSEATTRTIYGPRRRGYTSSRWTLETDRIEPFRSEPKAVADWAKSIIDNSFNPAVYLPGTPKIILDQDVPIPYVDQLLRVGMRENLVIEILDPPDDIPNAQIVTGGTIRIKGKRLELRLALVAGSAYGIKRVRWNGINAATDPDQKRRLRFADYAALSPNRPTFADYTATRTS